MAGSQSTSAATAARSRRRSRRLRREVVHHQSHVTDDVREARSRRSLQTPPAARELRGGLRAPPRSPGCAGRFRVRRLRTGAACGRFRAAITTARSHGRALLRSPCRKHQRNEKHSSPTAGVGEVLVSFVTRTQRKRPPPRMMAPRPNALPPRNTRPPRAANTRPPRTKPLLNDGPPPHTHTRPADVHLQHEPPPQPTLTAPKRLNLRILTAPNLRTPKPRPRIANVLPRKCRMPPTRMPPACRMPPPKPPRMADASNVRPPTAITAAANPIAILRSICLILTPDAQPR